MQKLKVLDLFSGIGGFSLGLERTGGFETVAFCEIEEYPRKVLQKHWPKVPIYHDVRELTADTLRRDGIAVDVICGGFPCQDISRAGTGAGLDGERSGLWREYARLIGEIRPRYALMENVAALLDNGMDVVCGDLARLGYDAEWQVISACAMGAPHMRQRVFIVAYPDSEHGWPWFRHPASREIGTIQEIYDLAGARAREGARLENPSALYRGADGVAFGMERNRAIGNGIHPAVPQIIGRAILQAEGMNP
jgi:DNA (cytosine-5)-methyltransferase 1